MSQQYRLITKCISGKEKLENKYKREMKKIDVKMEFNPSLTLKAYPGFNLADKVYEPKGVLPLFSKATFVGVAEPRQNQATHN